MNLPNITHKQGIIIAFAIGFIVRLIPEMLSFPYPIGWDTIYYAYRINDGALFGYWNSSVSTWLLYGILIFLGNLTQLTPFMLLKIVAPLLFGGSAAGIYFVAWKKLNWSVTKCLLTSSFFVFQLGALAISWHFYRNVFGAMIFLFTLPLLKHDINWKETGFLSLLSLLVVLGHESVAVSLFFIVFGLLVKTLLCQKIISYRLFLSIIPAFVVFLVNVFGLFNYHVSMDANILYVSDSVFPHPGGLNFLTDYLQVSLPNQFYSNYFELFSHVFSLFFLLFLIIMPLIGVGYFKDAALNLWTGLLLIGAFGCLVVPFCALFLWHRWMLMLVFPFTFFAANGLWMLLHSNGQKSFLGFFQRLNLGRKVGISLSLLLVVIAGLFLCFPLVDGKFGIIGVESTFKYVPSTMQSSSVPLQDTKATIAVFDWLNDNMSNDSSVLVHDVFEFWTLLYLDKNHTAIVFDNDLEAASISSSENGYIFSYLVWWNESIGWYDLTIPENYQIVQNFDRISIYVISNV